MRSLKEFNSKNISIVFSDIDDTITSDGLLPANSYTALWRLHEKNFKLIPVTGRPAGWCEMIARFWPVTGIVGENGGFYFSYDRKTKQMKRYFFNTDADRKKNRDWLDKIAEEILSTVPGSAIASDQFTRLMDLAIDFREDVPPLEKNDVEKIVEIFEKHGAQAKVSSIHVNGWFGEYDKLTMCKTFLKQELGLSWTEANDISVFIGDSPNDEPLFAAFTNSVGVRNIRDFLGQLKSAPRFICDKANSDGFCELADHLLKNG